MSERAVTFAKIVRQHEYALGLRAGTICTCGFVPTVEARSLRSQQDYFVGHLAEVLADSPAMRDLLAEAWDEGWDEGADDTFGKGRSWNPYRAEADR